MKFQILAASLLGLAAVIGCSPSAESLSDGAAATVPAGYTKVVLAVPDMHCQYSCGPAVREALEKTEGVYKDNVGIDIATHEATIYTDETKFDLDGTLAMLEEKGFPATVKQ